VFNLIHLTQTICPCAATTKLKHGARMSEDVTFRLI